MSGDIDYAVEHAYDSDLRSPNFSGRLYDDSDFCEHDVLVTEECEACEEGEDEYES